VHKRKKRVQCIAGINELELKERGMNPSKGEGEKAKEDSIFRLESWGTKSRYARKKKERRNGSPNR